MSVRINIPIELQDAYPQDGKFVDSGQFVFTITNFQDKKEDIESSVSNARNLIDFDAVEVSLIEEATQGGYMPVPIVNDKIVGVRTKNSTTTEVFTGVFCDAITSVQISANTDSTGISTQIVNKSYTSIEIELVTNDVDQDYTITLVSENETFDFNFQVLTITGTGAAGTLIEDFTGNSVNVWNDIGTNSFSFSTGSTPSSGTGANTPPTGVTQYAFAETSGIVPGNTFILETTDFATATEITYDYHMYGNTMGELKFQYSQDNGVNWVDIDVFTGQQQVNQTDDWITKTTDLSLYPINALRFFYTNASSFRADASITNIQLTSV